LYTNRAVVNSLKKATIALRKIRRKLAQSLAALLVMSTVAQVVKLANYPSEPRFRYFCL
jgi:hypothetical protein